MKIFWILQLVLVTVSSSRLVLMETSRYPSASICVSVPPVGEVFHMPQRGSLEVVEDSRSLSEERNEEWTGDGAVQYFVRSQRTGELFWAGEAIIPGDLLAAGPHILYYEETIINSNRHSLNVWWDKETIPFKMNEAMLLDRQFFFADHVSLFLPLQLARSAHAKCIDNKSLASMQSDHNDLSAVTMVTSIIIVVCITIALLVMLCLHLACKNGRLNGRENLKQDFNPHMDFEEEKYLHNLA